MKDQVLNFKFQIDRELESFLSKELENSRINNEPMEKMEVINFLNQFILSGGKRLRPFLFYYSYQQVGDGVYSEQEILQVSMALEFLHTYFLIHDDIIDQDFLRHNVLTVHRSYIQEYQDRVTESNLGHFGNSMAMLSGDLAASWMHKVLLYSNLNSDTKIAALKMMEQINSDTVLGEMIDQTVSVKRCFSELDVLTVYDYKTARYTIAGPLLLMAVIANKTAEEMHFIRQLATPLGIAYQLQDDIIGLFGTQEQIGKPVGSDIREGKKTVLMSYVMQNSGAKDRDLIVSKLGKTDLSLEEIETVKQAVINSGALAYTENKINDLIADFYQIISQKNQFGALYDFMGVFCEALLKRKR